MSNIKNIPSRLWINKYLVKFEYDTKRNNHKLQERYIYQTNEDDAKRDFWIWLNTMKEKEPHRAMLNANILSIFCDGGEMLEINK